jgi:hypothetical protein
MMRRYMDSFVQRTTLLSRDVKRLEFDIKKRKDEVERIQGRLRAVRSFILLLPIAVPPTTPPSAAVLTVGTVALDANGQMDEEAAARTGVKKAQEAVKAEYDAELKRCAVLCYDVLRLRCVPAIR